MQKETSRLEKALSFLFEDKPSHYSIPERDYNFADCCELVIDKLDYLAVSGVTTFQQAEIAKKYLPYCEVEDLLMFILGYKGFLSEALYS